MIEPSDLLLTGPAVLAAAGAGFYAGQRWAKARYWPGPKVERPRAEEALEDAPDEDEAAEARSLVSQRKAGLPLSAIAAEADDEAPEDELPALPVSVTVPPRLAELMQAGLPKPVPPAEAIEVLEEAAPGGQIHVPADWPEERRAELGADPEARREHIAEILGDMAEVLQDEADAELRGDPPKPRAKPKPEMKAPARTLPIVRRDPEPAPPVAAAALEAPPWVKWNDPSVLAATPAPEVAPAPAEVAPDPDCAPPEPGTYDAGHEPACAPEPAAPSYEPPPSYDPPAPAYEAPAPSYDPPSYDSGSSSSYDSGGGGGGYSGGE